MYYLLKKEEMHMAFGGVGVDGACGGAGIGVGAGIIMIAILILIALGVIF